VTLTWIPLDQFLCGGGVTLFCEIDTLQIVEFT